MGVGRCGRRQWGSPAVLNRLRTGGRERVGWEKVCSQRPENYESVVNSLRAQFPCSAGEILVMKRARFTHANWLLYLVSITFEKP